MVYKGLDSVEQDGQRLIVHLTSGVESQTFYCKPTFWGYCEIKRAWVPGGP